MEANSHSRASEAENSLLANLDISSAVDKLGRLADSVAPLTQPIARAFAANIGTVESLLMLPKATVTLTVRRTQFSNMVASAALSRGVDYFDPGLQREAQLVLDSAKMQEMLRGTANMRINELLNLPDYENAVRAIFTSAVAFTWTAIEVLTGDLWETLLNAHPTAVPVSFSEKVLPLTTLHRYGFDLRQRMGTILRPKVSFKSVEGIRSAFDVVSKGMAAPLDCRPMLVLEATRHILVHRAGLIDDDYIAAWKQIVGKAAALEFKSGDAVPLDACIVSAFVNTASFVGGRLVRAADAWAEARA